MKRTLTIGALVMFLFALYTPCNAQQPDVLSTQRFKLSNGQQATLVWTLDVPRRVHEYSFRAKVTVKDREIWRSDEINKDAGYCILNDGRILIFSPRVKVGGSRASVFTKKLKYTGVCYSYNSGGNTFVKDFEVLSVDSHPCRMSFHKSMLTFDRARCIEIAQDLLSAQLRVQRDKQIMLQQDAFRAESVEEVAKAYCDLWPLIYPKPYILTDERHHGQWATIVWRYERERYAIRLLLKKEGRFWRVLKCFVDDGYINRKEMTKWGMNEETVKAMGFAVGSSDPRDH